jgi:hypothetical protein
MDTDCPMVGSVTKVCKDNKCQIKCTKDLDCDPFYHCDTATSACVSGCIPTLCIPNREPLAVCTSGDYVPCQSDPCVAVMAARWAGHARPKGLCSSHCVDGAGFFDQRQS